MRLKEKALSRTAPLGVKPTRYRPDDNLLGFLELCRVIIRPSPPAAVIRWRFGIIWGVGMRTQVMPAKIFDASGAHGWDKPIGLIAQRLTADVAHPRGCCSSELRTHLVYLVGLVLNARCSIMRFLVPFSRNGFCTVVNHNTRVKHGGDATKAAFGFCCNDASPSGLTRRRVALE
jgi:hypothetical protein